MDSPDSFSSLSDVASPPIYDAHLEDYDHVTWYVSNAKQAAWYYISKFGFKPLAYKGLETGSRSVAAHVVSNNKVIMVFVSALRFQSSNPEEQKQLEEIHDHVTSHGDAIKDVAFTVDNAEGVYVNSVLSGAEPAQPPIISEDEFGRVVIAKIQTYGDTTHSLVERGNYHGPFLPGFRTGYHGLEDQLITHQLSDPVALEFIDHVVGNQDWGSMEDACSYYQKMLGFHRFWSVDDRDICTEYSSLRSVVMASENERIKMPINEPAKGLKKSQIEEFIEYYNGPGVQHLALRTENIIEAIVALKSRGVEFITVPSTYYQMIRQRLARSTTNVPENLDILEQLSILIDFDNDGYLLQIFTKPLLDRPTVFIEIIQRRNFTGFGVGNFKALFEAIERDQQLRGNL